jgi:hypothetical protein
MIHTLRWIAGSLIIFAAISFSLLAYYDLHIRDLESSLEKKRDIHHRITSEVQRAIDEYNSSFSTRDHVEILEKLNEDEKTVNLIRRNVMGSIRHAILMIRANNDIFKRSQEQNEEMLSRLSTPDELSSIFKNDLIFIRDYLNKITEENITAMSDISGQKTRKSTMYLITVAVNSLALWATLFFGPIQRPSVNPPATPPVQTRRHERRRR